MGKFTVEKWRCDRCGTVLDKRPPHPGIRVSIKASEDYQTTGGPAFIWQELCNPCNARVREHIADILKAREAEKDTPENDR